MDNKKIRQIVIGVVVCVVLIAFAIVYKMGSSKGEQELKKVVNDKVNEEVKKQNDMMARVKLQEKTEVYVCQFKDPKTLLYNVYKVIHKKNCPKMESTLYMQNSYWNLIHSYSDKFTFCPYCWTAREIEALEDKGQ